MNFNVAISVVFILMGLWNLMIAILGLFPRFRTTAVGTLLRRETYRNIQTRAGRANIPILTRYTYTYTVNGKKYRYTREGLHSKGCLLPRATMVYVKGFPRRAYLKRFTGEIEWAVGILLLVFGVLLLLMAMAPA